MGFVELVNAVFLGGADVIVPVAEHLFWRRGSAIGQDSIVMRVRSDGAMLKMAALTYLPAVLLTQLVIEIAGSGPSGVSPTGVVFGGLFTALVFAIPAFVLLSAGLALARHRRRPSLRLLLLLTPSLILTGFMLAADPGASWIGMAHVVWVAVAAKGPGSKAA